ncbi:MAG: signal peptidase I [bacterium]|nr:signal peptidase I [bacterium]
MSEKTEGSRGTSLILEIVILLTALAAVVVLRLYFFQSSEVISRSMQPAFNVGDRFIYLRTQGEYRPQRGDIVSIQYDDTLMTGEELVKRVVGLPGEEIGIYSGRVYINGKKLDEPYIKEPMTGDSVAYRIPEKMIFVMGDNRNNSEDSRVWGPMPVASVLGCAKLAFWPLSRFRILR